MPESRYRTCAPRRQRYDEGCELQNIWHARLTVARSPMPAPVITAARRVALGTVTCRMQATSFKPLSWTGTCSSGSFLTRKGFDEFRRVVSRLRVLCPTGKPVVIRTAWLPPTTLGECIRRPSRFVIRLNNRLDEQGAIETVLHEWGHALAWNYSLDSLAKQPDVDRDEFERASHDEAWGCAYARVWRTYSVDILARP